MGNTSLQRRAVQLLGRKLQPKNPVKLIHGVAYTQRLLLKNISVCVCV